MSVSSAGQGLRPGVCTSSTRPSSPYTGQTIYEVDTGYLRVWDGSAWDYLSQKQDTAQGPWTTWTPTFSATSGSFTTLTTNTARYTVLNKIVFGALDVTITTIGTASDVMRFTLPVTAKQSPYVIGSWRDINVSGETGVYALNSTTSCELRRYDNGAYLTNNDRYVGCFTYEAP